MEGGIWFRRLDRLGYFSNFVLKKKGLNYDISCLVYLSCGARLYRAELLVSLGVPELVETNVENYKQLQTTS